MNNFPEPEVKCRFRDFFCKKADKCCNLVSETLVLSVNETSKNILNIEIMEDWLVPLVAIICAVGLPVLLLIVLVVRTTRSKHEERMAMIEKGIVLEEPERKANKFNALRNGLLMIGLALGAICGIALEETMPSDWEGFAVIIFTVLGGGIAYLAYFFIVLKMMEKEKEQ